MVVWKKNLPYYTIDLARSAIAVLLLMWTTLQYYCDAMEEIKNMVAFGF